MAITIKQYYTPKPEPPCVTEVLVELNRLIKLNSIEEQRFHCAYMPESQDWAFGSNFEEGWDSLIYREAESKWVWRYPWDGSDEYISAPEPKEMVHDLLTQFIDPLAIIV